LSYTGKSSYRGTRKEMHVSEVTYISRIRVEPVEGKIRRAHLSIQQEPVLFGVHSEVAEHYGLSPNRLNLMTPPSITWWPQPAADCLAPFRARWQRVKFPSIKIASTPRRWGR
jgi:hypothetical protein